MADLLTESLAGLQTNPMETGYGVALQGLGAVTPQLINPYGSTGQAIGIGLGSILIQSLLGYQARQSALQDTLQANSLANQMIQLQTPQERTGFIEGLDVDPRIGGRLANLSTVLTQQELAQKAETNLMKAKKLAELNAAADFSLGDTGTKLFEREKQKEIDVALAKQTPTPARDWFKDVPAAQQAAFTGTVGQVQQLRDLANKFRSLDANAVELNAAKMVPGSQADLAVSAMQTLVPSTVKMLGDTGALSAYDQEAVKKATLGGMLSGSQAIAARLDQLADLAQTKTTTAMEQYKIASERGGSALLQQLTEGQPQTGMSETDKRKEEIRRQIAEMRALLAQRGK